MTKAELVEEVARAAELTKKDSEVIVDEVFKNIIQALNRGEKIELRGFGSFRVRERGARLGRNPKTGEPVDIPAKRVPYFKPGKELKELINDHLSNEDLEAIDDSEDNEDNEDSEGGEGHEIIGNHENRVVSENVPDPSGDKAADAAHAEK